MAQVETGVLSPTGDALLLAALFAPFAPIGITFNFHLITYVLGCPADSAQACIVAGLDFNHLFARSAGLLEKAASASGDRDILLGYLLALAVLAQLTIKGFRGRVVRTCAVIMWGAVVPLIVALASAMTRSPEQFCASGACDAGAMLSSIGLYAKVFFNWVATTAVPLGVMVAGLLAFTLGYAAMIKWVFMRVRRMG